MLGKLIFWGERLIGRIQSIIVILAGLAWLRSSGVRWFYYLIIPIGGLLLLWIEYKFVIKAHGKEWKKYYGE